jgi:hypothetical protein
MVDGKGGGSEPRVLAPDAAAPAFTLRDYRAMLEVALESGYAFRGFDDPARDETEPVCLLRHDIDVDLGAALTLAEVEAELGVSATYFVMLRSPVYNLFGRANHRLVQAICGLGHRLGLHYDQGFDPDPARSLHDWIELEAAVLGDMFGTPIGAVSFHQPGPLVLEEGLRLERLVNTYDRDLLADYAYVSDSNMVWRDRPAIDLFRGRVHPRLHLLIHPVWWVAEMPGTTTMDAFDRALSANWRRSQAQMLETERAYGPERTFTIGYP